MSVFPFLNTQQANILEQLQALVQIVPMPPSELKQRLGSQALMVINGTISDLPATSILKHEGQKNPPNPP